MATTDNPATEPVLSDLLYKDATPAASETDSPTEPETTDEEVVEDAESTTEEVESKSEESDTETETEAEPEFEVVEDGEKRMVTRKELVDGYQRHADYTRKTQAVAQERKAVEAQRAVADQTVQVLTDISGEIQSLIMGDLSEVNWDDLRTNNTSEYLRLKELQAVREKALSGLVEKRNQIVKQRTDSEAVELHKALGWNSDAKKKQADIDTITGFMQERGITDQVTSHRLMLAILDAAKYQQLQIKQVETEKEVKKAPKTTKPVKTVKAPQPKTLEELLYGK